MNKTRNAFTLIELLVVIVIIAILAAILFPVFASAREKARQATCASNEKQIGLAMLQYAQDFDEHIVSDRLYTSTGNYESWDSLIMPYVGLGKANTSSNNGINADTSPLTVCPDDLLSHSYSNNAAHPRSYAMIASGATAAQVTANPYLGTSDGAILSNITAPDRTFLLAEYQTSSNNAGDYHSTYVGCPVDQINPPDTYPYSGGPYTFTAAPVHSGGWNYLYCDGHVKWLNPLQTLGPGGSIECAGMSGGGSGPGGPWSLEPGTQYDP